VPLNSCSRIAGQCCPRYSGNSSTVIPSIPGLPWLARTRFIASLRFSRSHTSSITRWFPAGSSVSLLTLGASAPSLSPRGASLPPANGKASCSWFFCRSSLMRFEPYEPLQSFGPSLRPRSYYALCCLLPCGQVASRLPQSCRHDTEQTSWGISSRLPRGDPSGDAGSTRSVFDEYGLRRAGLARPTLAPHIRFLFIDSRFCSMLPSDPASRRRLCISLTLHLHQVG